jgi:chromosome condensin MukBEF MukE localization factor
MHNRSVSSFLLPGCLVINGESHSSSMRLCDAVMRIGASQDSGDSEEAQVAAVRRLISLGLRDAHDGFEALVASGLGCTGRGCGRLTSN